MFWILLTFLQGLSGRMLFSRERLLRVILTCALLAVCVQRSLCYELCLDLVSRAILGILFVTSLPLV